MTENQPGELITRTFMTSHKVLYELDALIERLEMNTGKRVSRSRFITLLVEIILKHNKFIDTSQIYNDKTLEDQLANAIAKGVIQSSKREDRNNDG